MSPPPPKYPVLREDCVVDDYHGTSIADPFRWLENPESEEVQQFVKNQNEITRQFLDQCSQKDIIDQKLIELSNYSRFSCPIKSGDKYYYFKNSGLQKQSVLYVQKCLEEEGEVFMDPNTLSKDGTVEMQSHLFSEDGETLAYALSTSGSDWTSIHFKKVCTRQDYPEILKRVKFNNFEWTKDGKGVIYGRYPDPDGKGDGSETTLNENQKLYYHQLGTEQAEDVLIVEFPDHPKWIFRAQLSNCGKYLLVVVWQDACDNIVFYASIAEQLVSGFKTKLELIPLVSTCEAYYEFVASDETVFYFCTSKGAPNYKIASIDLSKPINDDAWTTVVPEHSKNVLEWATPINKDNLMVSYMEDAKSTLELRNLKDGSLLQTFPLEVGTVVKHSGKREHTEFFYQFDSFLTPKQTFHINFSETPLVPKVIREEKPKDFNPSEFETTQIFYSSSDDGTKVPMFIVHKKNITLDGTNPCLLYGYGGFGISIVPTFSKTYIFFMKHYSGILAFPNIRGGGEYGEAWHDGGRLLNKQNTFNDFQTAAEYLIDKKYTNPKKQAIEGGSNGGLLVGACINQRPDLFGAAIAEVGVFDMLRFDKFTIGYAWCVEYGCSHEKKHFENLIKYSPLHNVRLPEDEAVQYPSVLLCTADHDDRVVPLHSYKFIATLQKEIGRNCRQTNPLLLQVESQAGHGGGGTSNDVMAFLVLALGMTFQP